MDRNRDQQHGAYGQLQISSHLIFKKYFKINKWKSDCKSKRQLQDQLFPTTYEIVIQATQVFLENKCDQSCSPIVFPGNLPIRQKIIRNIGKNYNCRDSGIRSPCCLLVSPQMGNYQEIPTVISQIARWNALPKNRNRKLFPYYCLFVCFLSYTIVSHCGRRL